MNVPDDWHQYHRMCDRCGAQYHESDGECLCEERRLEAQQERIWSAIAKTAAWMTNAVYVGPGPVITLSRPMSRACGYHAAEQDESTKDNRRTLLRILDAVADLSGEEIELRATEEDGKTWTVEVLSCETH